jgi:Major capsid protein N-terminus/Large eukaryotic DNA virus major capsid protein
MPGGLLQLVATGAQNELVNGNPSMTHFRAVYRRHTNFAMEHIRMTFTNSNLEFSTTGTKTIQCRVDRYAQLLHDTYLVLTLPNIWSPLVYVGNTLPSGYGAGTNISANSIGYEFQWIQNIGYNLIDHVDLVMNGQVIQSLPGEWMKIYSYLTHDADKRAIVDQMVGNVKELYDPANAYDRQGQYPHAVSPTDIPTTIPMTTTPEPSIRSRQLIIPLHFFFCENPGLALPLVSLQNSEVYINVTLRNLNDLYTVIDVNPANSTYGTRIKPTGDKTYNGMNLFLSPPLADGTPSNPGLTTWFPDTYLEGNFIYLTEMEMNQLARADQVYLIKNVNYIHNTGQFGANTDLLLPMFNLITRIVFGSQRSDKISNNDWDNYTNWDKPNRAPFTSYNTNPQIGMLTSGQQQISSVYPRDTINDAVLLLDGKERFQTKQIPFFSLLQMYRHTTGNTPKLPGVYMYSFALDHDTYQPSGAINGSMFNKIILRASLQQPLPASTSASTTSQVCILKSTAFSPNPTIIPAGQIGLYTPDQLLTVVQTNDNIIFVYTYNAFAYVESVNFLRIVSGLANLVFAS